MENKTYDFNKEDFLSFLDDNNQVVTGYFQILEISETYVKILTKGNIVIIPMHRILKIKISRKS